MNPMHLLALLLFLTGTTWTLTRSDRAVREIQARYYAAVAPFLNAGSAMETRARSLLEEVEHSKALSVEVEALRSEVGRLRIIESRFRELERENGQLRHALNFQQNTSFDVVAAHVIRRYPTTWWQTLEIDAGSNRGIGTQLSVLSDEGLVGKIDRIDRSGERASVILLTDEQCQVSARIEGTPEVGILSGQRGHVDGTPRLRLRFLSKNAAVRPGLRVFTTGRGGIFQPNILIGTVESVEKGPLDSEAIVRPSVNFEDLSTVFVVLTDDS